MLIETITSILTNQTVTIEIIIVDDGSTDNTHDLIKQIKDDRVSYYKIENRERGAARNYGLKMATGDYVNYFDSDDILNPCLKDLYAFIEQAKYPEVIFGQIECVTETDEHICIVNPRSTRFKDSILYNNFLACGSVFLRRDIAAKFQFSEDRMLSGTEDWELWLRVYSDHDFKKYPKIIFKQRQHKSRSLNNRGVDNVQMREFSFIKHIEGSLTFLKKRFSDSDLDLLIADRHTLVALAAFESSRKQLALKQLIMAFNKSAAVLLRRRFWAVVKKLITE